MDRFWKKDDKQDCKYGGGCYQKNPAHKAKFKHPEDEGKTSDNVDGAIVTEAKTKPIEADVNKENKENERKSPNKKRVLSEDGSEVDGEENKKIRLHAMSSSEESQDEDTSNEDAEAEKSKADTDNNTKEDEVYDDLIEKSPEDMKEDLKLKYLITMPEDFFVFYDFCKSLNTSDPLQALSSAGLKLCGPYDTLGNNIPESAPRSERLFLTHGRYYYDPPEMTTVVCETEYKTGFHIGYLRDAPREAPVFLVGGSETEGAKLTVLGDNIFAAVYHHLSAKMESVDPFQRSKISAVAEKIKLWVNRSMMEGNNHSLNLDKKSASMKNRDRSKVATTFHGAGIVVPYNKQTEVGYREIPETTASLKKILKNVVEAETDSDRDKALDVLQEIVTNVQFANDEGDPGMGLELGLDLLCYGGERLHNTIRHLLGVAYELLDRDEFGKIINCHLQRRRKGVEQDSFAKWRQT